MLRKVHILHYVSEVKCMDYLYVVSTYVCNFNYCLKNSFVLFSFRAMHKVKSFHRLQVTYMKTTLVSLNLLGKC